MFKILWKNVRTVLQSVLEEGCSFFKKVKERLCNSEQYLEIYRCLDVFNRGIISRVELDSLDAYRLQLKLFLYEVKQQQLLSGVRTFLKVYSTISLGKLATYMEVDEPTLWTILMSYKHKTHAVDSEGKVFK